MSADKKLSATQSAVLSNAASTTFISFYAAARVGGNGKTLSALTERGLLQKIEYPDGSKEWRITDAGKAALWGAA